MNCEQTRRLMDDYLGGYLEAADRQAVENHTETCGSCRASLEELQSLLQQAQGLPRGIPPARDLWPGVLAQIEETKARSRLDSDRSWLALAAVLAMAVLLLPLLLRQRAAGPEEQATTAVAESMAIDNATLAKADLARFEDRVLLMRRDLVEAFEIRRELLGPEASKSVERSLRDLDQAVAEIRLALEDNPNDRRLRLLLAAKYQHEVRLLQRVSRV